MHVILDENETYKSAADEILNVDNIKNYNKYIEKFLSRLDYKEDCKEDEDVKDEDFEIKIVKKICYYMPCMNEVIGDNYCLLHNKDMI